jgi:hypothetical protein
MELLHNIINISYNIITFIYFVFFCYCVYLKITKKDIIKPLIAINHRKKLSLVIGLVLCFVLAFTEAWSRGALK